MKNKYIKKIGVLLLACVQFSANAQNWAKKMDDNNVNFYQVQQDFNAYWKNRKIEKGKGYKQYKRWEWFVEPRVYPSGERTQMMKEYSIFHDQNNKLNTKQKTNAAGSWSLVGPTTVPSGDGGAGRINFVTFHPTSSNTIYVGSPGGGLWYSNDGGSTWNTNTDNLEVIGTSDLIINPEKPTVMYLATGDGDGGSTYSIGVLKSCDAGVTWSSTGLGWSVSAGYKINKLLMSTSDTSIIIAATNGGIYESLDAGNSWSLSQSGNFKDIEFKPGDPSIVYACGEYFYKSTDGGRNFSQITSGLPSSSSISRFAIATTTANSSYVYILASNNSDYGFYGFYKSTDNGTTFTAKATTPNLLGWESDGSDAGGQGWYDLSIVASPTSANEVYIGGVNIWKTTDGGSNWTVNSHWYGQNGNPYVHADIHCLKFNNTDLYAGCDGGLFKTANSGVTWSDISDGLVIHQSYRIGLSVTNKDLFMIGNQDNGTDANKSGTWTRVLGGDGMECFIDYTDEKYMYGEYYYGSLERSSNSGLSFTSINSGITETGAWVTPFIMDPSDPKILYAGFNNVWKTTDRGNSWTAISNFGSSNTLNAIAVAASNTSYIYAATYSKIYKTSNGGSNWTDISSGLPVSSASLTYITIDPADAQHVYVTFSGYSSGKKVYETKNAGSSWTNISGTLPNLPVNCITYEKGSSDGLYIGTDIGIYYKDNSMTDWISFSNGLPSVVIDELEIQYTSGVIKAATFGRGVWESPLNSSQSMAPTPDFNTSATDVCLGTTIQFTDNSGYSPSSWAWSFPGGNPSTSTDQNPSVTYATAGVYDVTLIATNKNGSTTTTKTSYINVGGESLPYTEDLNASAFPPSGWEIVNSDNGITWDQTSAVSANGSTSNCAYMHLYNYSSIGQKDNLLTDAIDLSNTKDSVYLTFNVAYGQYSNEDDALKVYVSTDCGDNYNATPIFSKSGNSLATVSPNTTEFYPTQANDWRAESVDISNYAGQSVVLKFESTCDYGNNLFLDDINIISTGTTITAVLDQSNNIEKQLYLYPNPAKDILNIVLHDQKNKSFTYELSDISGNIVYSGTDEIHSGTYKSSIAINTFASGVYFFKMKTKDENLNQKIIIE